MSDSAIALPPDVEVGKSKKRPPIAKKKGPGTELKELLNEAGHAERKSRGLVALSGGMDSATVLKWAQLQGHEVRAFGFRYPSKHNRWELGAAQRTAQTAGVEYEVIDLCSPMEHIKSNLLKDGGEIPEGHYHEESMRQTVVPGRNTIFIAVLAGIAQSIGFDYVLLGIHQGDHHIYPDCRPEYYDAIRAAVTLSSENKVGVVAPFLNWTKADIVKFGLENGVQYALTRTCYKAQAVACGKCGACQERLEAFKTNRSMDPITYESK